MLGLLASASLCFSSLPEPVCVCGNYPLYATMAEAGEGGHSMCFFGTTAWMPSGGTMSAMTSDTTCPSGMADETPPGLCYLMNDTPCDESMDMGR